MFLVFLFQINFYKNKSNELRLKSEKFLMIFLSIWKDLRKKRV